MSGYKLFERPS